MDVGADYSTNVELSTGERCVLLKIGERLKEERVRLGFNQTDFAALAGVAKTSQFNYEKDERSPDAAYLAAVAAAGVDVLYVVTGHRSPVAAAALSEAETQLVDAFRAMAAEDQAAVLRLSSSLSSSGTHKLTDKL